jgi:ABC-type lipoprotein release transport system permease subunit
LSVRALRTWTLRGLSSSPGLYVGLAVLVGLVTVLVPGARRAGRTLHATIEGWAKRLELADVEIVHAPALAGQAERVRGTPGVRAARERLKGPGRLELDGGLALAAVVEVLPRDGPPGLNGLAVVTGRYPDPGERAALVDRSVAAWHGVAPGSSITVRITDATLVLPVVGVVIAAEHPVIPVHPEHALPERGALAPVWVTPASVESLTDLKGRTTSLLLALEPGTDPRAAASAAAERMDASVAGVVPREEGPAQRFADMVLAVFDAYLPTVDIVLSVLAATLLALVIQRRVRAQRAEAAVWLALGARPGAVALALAAPGVLTTLVGSAIGLVGHGAFAAFIHGSIERSMGIAPAIDPGIGPDTWRLTALLAATAALAGGLEAWALLRRRPARLLREGAHAGGGLARHAALLTRRLPTSVLLGSSHVFSRPLSALALMLALAGSFASLLAFNDVHLSYEVSCVESVRRTGLDAIVRLDGPRDAAVLDELALRAQGRAEPLLTGLGLVTHESAERFVQVVGLDASGWGSQMRVYRGRRLAPGADGEAVADRWLAEALDLRPGMRLEVFPSRSAPEGLSVELVGVVETMSVGRVYVSAAAAQSLLGLAGQVNGAHVASSLPRRELEAALSAVPGVERALSLTQAQDEVLATLEGGRVVLRLGLLFTALLAATFLAVVGAMDARERLADAAVLHALGWGDRSLAVVVGVEMAIRTALALVFGLLGSVPLTRLLLERLGDADRHTLDAHPSPSAPWALAAVCLVLVPLAAMPACRALLKLSPARSLKLLSGH